jgi:hypothetical protein
MNKEKEYKVGDLFQKHLDFPYGIKYVVSGIITDINENESRQITIQWYYKDYTQRRCYSKIHVNDMCVSESWTYHSTM